MFGEMAKKIVLVVDDDKDVLHVIGDMLKRDGWQVLGAERVEAVWGLLESLEEKPCIALIDLNISEKKDGLSLARKLKTAIPQMEVVILSGYFTDAERYPNEFYYVDKPFKLSELIIICNGLLKPTHPVT